MHEPQPTSEAIRRPPGPIRLFYSYAHEDVSILTDLRKHLAPLRHEEVIEDWYDRRIRAGSDWNMEITKRLDAADIVIVLLSADFVASEYAYGRELRRAIELHGQSAVVVVPVLARPCLWENLPIAKLQALPEGGIPITAWDDRDAALLSVVRGVAEAARHLVSTRRSLADEWIEYRLARRRVIQEVQEHLMALGYYPGPIDGIPGPDTEDAIVAFQTSAQIEVDGRIGPETIRHLEVERRDP